MTPHFAKRLVYAITTGFGLGVIFFLGVTNFSEPHIISPIARAVKNTTPSIFTPTVTILPTPAPTHESTNSLKNVVENALSGSKGTYGIAIKHMGTKESYYQLEHRKFAAASLYKLWVMATVMDMIEHKILNKDEQLHEDISALNRAFGISPEFAELTEGTVNFSISQAFNQMITISHNYAALALSKRVKMTTVANYLVDNGLTESAPGDPPQTTASDTALFFEKLYAGQMVSSVASQQMVEILKGQKLNNKLPKHLSPTVVIAHKTGELGRVTHDAGIVYGGTGDYIISVLSESDAPVAAEERIAQLSKAVYTYFEKN